MTAQTSETTPTVQTSATSRAAESPQTVQTNQVPDRPVPYDASFVRRQFDAEQNFVEVFRRNARRFARKVALSDPVADKTWTYSELNAEANRWANAFAADGVRKGDVVSVALCNSPEFVFALLASEKLGAIFCPLNYNWSPDEIAYALGDSRPKLFAFDAELAPTVARAFERADFRPAKAIVVGTLDAERARAFASRPFPPTVDAAEYVAPFDSTEPARPKNVSAFDEIARLYTSGTTGRSKGVPMLRQAEAAGSTLVASRYPMTTRDVTINTTPWFHRGGFHGGLVPTLYLGGEVVVLRRFHPSVCFRCVQKRRVSIILGVPSAATMIARKQEKARADVSFVRLLVMMGSDLDRATCEYLSSVFPNIGFINSYGTTESFLNTFLDSTDLPEKAGTVGRAALEDDVVLVEPIEDGWGSPDALTPKDGKTLGEILIRCSSKTAYGYFNKPEESARKFRDGYLYTGDLAVWDDNEYIRIVGRKDDMMISAGENIYPQPIEEAICECPKVADCAVTCVDEPTRGQALVAYVVRSDATLDARELLKFCAESPRLSNFTIPRYFRFVDELPYTATGKKRRFVLKQAAPDDLKNGLLARN